MKRSLRHGAGYLVIDHRDSPGLSAADVAHLPGAMAVEAGAVLERDVQICTHCERAVVLEPLRVRDRGFCPKCNHYICDGCETIRVKTGACVPMRQILDHATNVLDRTPRGDLPTTPPIVLTDALKE
jgi:hypothetical protein